MYKVKLNSAPLDADQVEFNEKTYVVGQELEVSNEDKAKLEELVARGYDFSFTQESRSGRSGKDQNPEE